jgi:galactose mutarotase-like enzyme
MSHRLRSRSCLGVEILTLSNPALAVSIAPEFGARIVSLVDRASGREWLDGWSPAPKRRLWPPADPTDFASGPGAGIDECLPTVLPCALGRSKLPDHGELWNRRPELLADAEGVCCRWSLACLPLDFERRLSLAGGRVILDYRLANRGRTATPFLWAWHPLFSWKPGDQIRFPRTVTSCLHPGGTESVPWRHPKPGVDLSRAVFPRGETPAAKVFAGPLTRGHAEIHSRRGESLVLDWPAASFPYAGIWITRGFWKGLHHWAIEPTNAPVDRLSDILGHSPASLLEPGESRAWRLSVTLRP